MSLALSDLAGRRVGVWGAGREGVAALRALARLTPRPIIVVAADEFPGRNAELIAEIHPDARLVGAADAVQELRRCEVVIRSAGVSIYSDAHRSLLQAGVEMTTGTNLWFGEQAQLTSIGITGTKGKSTTAYLTTHLLGERYRVTLAGNVGLPLLDTLDRLGESDVFVIELSSHQVADLEHRPTFSVLLNLFPEHLHWHGSWERYYADKLRLLEGCTQRIANYLSEPIRERVRAQNLDVTWFNAPESMRASTDGIWRGSDLLYSAKALSLRGLHNRSNAAAALTIAASLGLPPESFSEQLANFTPLPHRLQVVGIFAGRTFVDDSISTTPESTLAALDALEAGQVVLIAGGTNRDQDYEELAERLSRDRNVVGLVALPETGVRLLEAVRRRNGARRLALAVADTVEEAVEAAVASSPPSATILLSPAAPSYGVYRDFEERGDRFVAAARAIAP